MKKQTETKQKDVKNIGNIDNKHLEKWDRLEREGLIRIPADPEMGVDARRSGQMHHNAGHALWYVSMAIHALIHGKKGRTSGRACDRMIAHLAHLREFVVDEDVKLEFTVNRLFRALMDEHPGNDRQWLNFIYMNWNLLCTLASFFETTGKCFKQEDYAKLEDRVYGDQFWRKWWWEMKAVDAAKQVRIKTEKWIHAMKERLS